MTDAVADALVYAISYIHVRSRPWNDEAHDDDLDSLGYVSYLLGGISEAEKDALALAAKRALARELANGATEDSPWVCDYRTWMQDLFGDDWIGNDRA
jgi:hypothetical protein